MEMQEIETKIRGLLSVKRYQTGLTEKEQETFNKLDKKYRNNKGHLIKGSFYINSYGNWGVLKW